MADMSAEAIGIYNKLSRILVAACVKTRYSTEGDLYFSIDEASQSKKVATGASVILCLDVRRQGAKAFYKAFEELLDADRVMDYRVEYQKNTSTPLVGGLYFDPVRQPVEVERRTYALFMNETKENEDV